MINLIKENKTVVLLYLLSFVLFCFGYLDKDTSIITATETIFRLAGYILLLLALLLLAVKYNKVLIINLIVLGLLIVGLESVSFFLMKLPARTVKRFDMPDVTDDHIAANVGSVPWADSVYHSVKKKEGRLVYDVLYSIDQFCKRATPGYDSTKTRHALFFGCSFTFGEGLNDNETFPYYFQLESMNTNSYNFAYSGFGTNHMLAWLEYKPLTEQVKEREGSAYYIFIWDHMYRSIGSMARYTEWLHNAPYYKFSNGVLVRDKMFKNGRKVLSAIYEWLYLTNTVRYFKIDLPPRLFDWHYDLVTEMIKESENAYKKQFGNNNFYVIMYPSFDMRSTEEYDTFKSYLERKSIRYIDLTHYIKFDQRYSLNGDPHPNAKTNELLAAETLRRLKE